MIAETLAVLDDVRCHCPAGPDGHTPGDDECGHPLKRAAVRPFRAGPTRPAGTARGTCPGCGRAGVKVVGHKVRGAVPGQPADARGVLLDVEPRLAPHRRPGKGAADCTDGPGRPPAELRFTPSARPAAWAAKHGQDAIR